MTAENPKQRLRRLERLVTPFPIFFITACTYKRRQFLAGEEIHDAFVEFAQNGSAYGAWVGSYVLMPDHAHFFVALDDEKISLPNWIKSLKNALSKKLREQKIPSPQWQKTFFDHVLRSSESYSEK